MSSQKKSKKKIDDSRNRFEIEIISDEEIRRMNKEDLQRVKGKLSVVTLLTEIRKELRGLRADLKDREVKNEEQLKEKVKALDDYKKWVNDFMQQKSQNLGTMLMPGTNLEDLKKNTAKVIKNMMNPDILNAMPKEFQEGYFGLMQGIMDPNDPAFNEEEKPDPREPIQTYMEGDPEENRCLHGITFGTLCEECRKMDKDAHSTSGN